MEYRKLISFGNSSHVISLPKQWLESHGLKKGDTIYLDVNGNDIVVTPAEIEEPKEKTEHIISGEELPADVIRRKISSAYINNADIIRIKGKNLPSKIKDIKKSISDLIAMEVVEQTADSIVVKSFLNMDEIDVKNILRKADHILTSMFEDLDLAAQDTEMSENISQRDEDVNRMCFLAFRSLNDVLKKGRRESTENVLRLWGFSFFLEEIADDVKRMGRQIAKMENLAEYMPVLKEARKNYVDAMKAFHTDDKSLVYEVAGRRDPLMKKCDDILEKNLSDPQMISLIDRTKDVIAKIHNLNRLSY